MPHKIVKGSPQEWLKHAKSDLILGKTRSNKHILLDTLAFHFQQAGEN
ncbi:MAG: hypothetical protein ACD_79C01415G0003 [uncultured bacterium]|nr:MAG: hypothetical protein ACD_79C01415G0003 [uncultured bacterium]